jgi:hypothetical protein
MSAITNFVAPAHQRTSNIKIRTPKQYAKNKLLWRRTKLTLETETKNVHVDSLQTIQKIDNLITRVNVNIENVDEAFLKLYNFTENLEVENMINFSINYSPAWAENCLRKYFDYKTRSISLYQTPSSYEQFLLYVRITEVHDIEL